MFNNLDWNFLQKKLLENPKAASLGAVGTVAAVTLVYFLTKSSNDIDDDMDDHIPEFAKQDIDYEFTSRFGRGKNRKRTMSDHNKRKRPKPLQNAMTNTQHNGPELKHQDMYLDEKEIKYSLLDPTNPNYSYDMTNEEESDEDSEMEEEETFSVDPYYVPFRVNNAKTRRKPDAPFMAMFKMYANKNKQSTELINNDSNDNKIEQEQHEMDTDEVLNGDDDDEKKEEKSHIDADIGSSPPLNPHIPSHNIGALNGMNNSGNRTVNSLDSLRERYYKQELPKSLQPDVLSNAFSSDNQKAIQNDLNADDSLLGGIKQSVQMIAHINE